MLSSCQQRHRKCPDLCFGHLIVLPTQNATGISVYILLPPRRRLCIRQWSVFPCLDISTITQKVFMRFSWNRVGLWSTVIGRLRLILWSFPILKMAEWQLFWIAIIMHCLTTTYNVEAPLSECRWSDFRWLLALAEECAVLWSSSFLLFFL